MKIKNAPLMTFGELKDIIRERDQYKEIADALLFACEAAIKDYERVFDGRGAPSIIAFNKLKAARDKAKTK